jgi:hypothetical protein
MNDKDIALKISEILGCRYSHHDLHYVDYELGGKHSLLTSYQGISPFTFSILEDGRIWTATRFLLDVLVMIKPLVPIDNQGPLTEYDKIIEAEKWLRDNNALPILIDNLSDYYKSKMDMIKTNQAQS